MKTDRPLTAHALLRAVLLLYVGAAGCGGGIEEAGPTETTSAAATPYRHPVGIYVPAYWGAYDATTIKWHTWLLNYVRSNKDVDWLIAINPSSGFAFHPTLRDFAVKYRAEGATVIGYISVNWGTQNHRYTNCTDRIDAPHPHTTLAYLKRQVDLYYRDYGVDGFMFDDAPAATWGQKDSCLKDSWAAWAPGQYDTYSVMKQLVDYARQVAPKYNRRAFIKANVGMPPDVAYFKLYDNINIFEQKFYPIPGELYSAQWYGHYDYASTFTVHHAPFNRSMLNAIAYRTKYISIHHSDFHHGPSNSLPDQIRWVQGLW